MDIKQFKKFYKTARRADVPVFIWGHGGTGKSSVMSQITEEEGSFMVSVNVAQMQDVGDFLGIIEFDRESFDVTTSTFATPTWLAKLNAFAERNPGKHAILFLDELNRGRPDIINVVLTMITARLVGTYKLAPNVIITGAGNFETKDYKTTKTKNDFALATRFCHINFTPSAEDFIDYIRNKHGEFFSSFLSKHPEAVNTHSKLVTPTIMGDASNRTMDMAFSFIAKANQDGLSREMITEACYGLIGPDLTTYLMSYINEGGDRPLRTEEVLDLTPENLAKFREWANDETGRRDLVAATLDNAAYSVIHQKLTLEQFTNFMLLIDCVGLDVGKSKLKEIVLQMGDNEIAKANFQYAEQLAYAPENERVVHFFQRLEEFALAEAKRNKEEQESKLSNKLP